PPSAPLFPYTTLFRSQTIGSAQTVPGAPLMDTELVAGSNTAVGDIADPTVGGARYVLERAAAASTEPVPTANMSCTIVKVTPVPRFVAEVYCPKPCHAVVIRRAFTWSGVRAGFCWRCRAATPLTSGAAILVPLIRM